MFKHLICAFAALALGAAAASAQAKLEIVGGEGLGIGLPHVSLQVSACHFESQPRGLDFGLGRTPTGGSLAAQLKLLADRQGGLGVVEAAEAASASEVLDL